MRALLSNQAAVLAAMTLHPPSSLVSPCGVFSAFLSSPHLPLLPVAAALALGHSWNKILGFVHVPRLNYGARLPCSRHSLSLSVRALFFPCSLLSGRLLLRMCVFRCAFLVDCMWISCFSGRVLVAYSGSKFVEQPLGCSEE